LFRDLLIIDLEETMFDIQTQLFEGRDIRFGPIDYEKDPEIEARWTHDSEFMRMMDTLPARPMSAALVKKEYEKLEKQMEEGKNQYYFAIRAREDDRLIGKASVQWIEWANGHGFIRLGIGSAEDRGKGYGSQALKMLLRFAFAELNLFRLSAIVPEYNTAAIHLLEKHGFIEEVRRRQSLERDGRRWDLLVFGLLSDEWRNHAQA
jgi:RimJ/RimL family protein N-acetyltransferase